MKTIVRRAMEPDFPLPSLRAAVVFKSLSIFFSVLGVVLCTPLVASAAPKAKLLEFWDGFEEASVIPVDHAPYDELLSRYVLVDHPSGVHRVRYEDFTEQDRQQLLAYVAYLQRFDPRQFNRDSALAYWLNLYNAGMILVVLANPKANLIIEVEGKAIWRRDRFEVAFQKLSFDDIQHGIIRPLWNDPRTHFALSCGCIGSGQVMPEAFTPENLDGLLDQATATFLASQRGMVITDDDIELTRIFRSYREDFGSNEEIAAFVRKFLDPAVQSQFDIVNNNRFDFFHSWRLNIP